MVYTITLNPSVDYIIQMDKISKGEVNKTKSEKIFPGGKGINVSVILNELECDSVCLGFVAGFTGSAIEGELKKMGVKTDFVHLVHQKHFWCKC